MAATLPAVIPVVMGVLNVTPDSFSDGGRFASLDAAVAHAIAMIDAGAGVIDIGGESTRPGATPVTAADEIDRVLPVVLAVSALIPVVEGRVEISIDTRNPETARVCVDAGATIINDVSSSLGSVAADLGASWIAMHMGGDPATMQHEPHYDDVVAEVLAGLVGRAEAARRAGVQRLWIDPGIGFGKTLDHNLALLGALDEFVATGYPVVLGVSRKSSLGVLSARADGHNDPTPVDDRLEGSLAIATWAMQCGVSMIRAHDVQAHVRAARVVAGTIESAA